MLSSAEIDNVLEKLDTKEILLLGNSKDERIEIIDATLYIKDIDILWSDWLESVDKAKFFSAINFFNKDKIEKSYEGYVEGYIAISELYDYVREHKTRVIVIIDNINKNELMLNKVFKSATFETMDMDVMINPMPVEKSRCGKAIVDSKRISFYLVQNPKNSEIFDMGDNVIFYYNELVSEYIFDGISRYNNIDVMDMVDYYKIKKYADAYKYFYIKKIEDNKEKMKRQQYDMHGQEIIGSVKINNNELIKREDNEDIVNIENDIRQLINIEDIENDIKQLINIENHDKIISLENNRKKEEKDTDNKSLKKSKIMQFDKTKSKNYTFQIEEHPIIKKHNEYLKTKKRYDYIKVIENLKNLTIEEVREKLFEINEYIASIIVELIRLDEEFEDNIDHTMLRGIDYLLQHGKRKVEYELINNKAWEGYWKNCIGCDYSWFISSIKEEISASKDVYEDNIISRFYTDGHGYPKIPYGLAMANEAYKRLFALYVEQKES